MDSSGKLDHREFVQGIRQALAAGPSAEGPHPRLRTEAATPTTAMTIAHGGDGLQTVAIARIDAAVALCVSTTSTLVALRDGGGETGRQNAGYLSAEQKAELDEFKQMQRLKEDGADEADFSNLSGLGVRPAQSFIESAFADGRAAAHAESSKRQQSEESRWTQQFGAGGEGGGAPLTGEAAAALMPRVGSAYATQGRLAQIRPGLTYKQARTELETMMRTQQRALGLLSRHA